MIEAGMKNGEMRRGPRFTSSVVGVFDQRQAADARTHEHADALGLFFGQLIAGRKTGIAHRLEGRREPVMDEAIHVPGFLGGDVILDLEALDLTREMARHAAGVEAGDGGNAGTSGEDVGPAFGNGIADRADQAKTCNDDTATGLMRCGSELREKEGAQAFWCLTA